VLRTHPRRLPGHRRPGDALGGRRGPPAPAAGLAASAAAPMLAGAQSGSSG